MRQTQPTILHLTSYAFSPVAHPAIHRTVTSLAPHVRNVVLTYGRPGYAPTPEAARPSADDRASVDDVLRVDNRLFKDEAYVRRLADEIRRRHPDAIAIVAHLGNSGRRGLTLARGLDLPILTIFGGTDAQVGLFSARHRPDYERLREAPVARFAAVSDNLRRRLLDFGMPPERTFVHRRGIDLASYGDPLPRPEASSLRVVMAGRCIPVKGHRTGFRAFAALRAGTPATVLHLFGDGPLLERLRALAGELGISRSVRFRGVVDASVLREELARSHVILHPSERAEDGRCEGIPNTLIEAMAAGVPPVATRHGGIPELVVHERTGLLAVERDVGGLAAALCTLAEVPALRTRLGVEAREHVAREHGATCQGERLARAIEAMCADYASIPTGERRRLWAELGPRPPAGASPGISAMLRRLTPHLRHLRRLAAG